MRNSKLQTPNSKEASSSKLQGVARAMAAVEEFAVCMAESALTVEMPNSGPLPTDIQWMPPGRHNITPFIDGEPKEVTMDVTAPLADRFNGQLQELRRQAAAGLGDVPYLDLNHKDDEASAEVLALYWGGEDPKAGGIRARVKWTSAGEQALKGRNYRRFSPTWGVSKTTGEPVGVGVNLGGLVNRAAFRNIARVVARLGAGVQPGAANERAGENKDMDRNEFKQMLEEGLKPIMADVAALKVSAKAATENTAGAATAQAGLTEEKIVKLFDDRLKPLSDEVKSLKDGNTEQVKAQAKAAVQVHINRGAIPPEDKETIALLESTYIANAAHAEKLMARLPGKTLARVTAAGAGGSTTTTTAAGNEPEEVFMAKAREYGKTNGLKNQAEAMAAFAYTAEGRELYTEFRKKITPTK